MVIGIFVAVMVFIPLQHASQDYILNWSLNMTTNTTAREPLNFMNNVWTFLMIPIILAFLFYGIMQSQKRRGDYA